MYRLKICGDNEAESWSSVPCGSWGSTFDSQVDHAQAAPGEDAVRGTKSSQKFVNEDTIFGGIVKSQRGSLVGRSGTLTSTSTVDSLTAVSIEDHQADGSLISCPSSALTSYGQEDDNEDLCSQSTEVGEHCSTYNAPFPDVSACMQARSSLSSVEGLPLFEAQRFRYQRRLSAAPRSGGQIELHFDCVLGCTVAVKHVPYQNLGSSPEAFRAANPSDPESPWQEFAALERVGSDGPCRVHGVARYHGTFTNSKGDGLLVMEHFPNGDLFSLASRLAEPSSQREAQVFPLVLSLIEAVYSLHRSGVSHGDLSLENAMWRPNASGHSQVALIDFGASVSSDAPLVTGRRGKPSYQAPEMHLGKPYDPKAADLFALGVAIYALMLKGYPWSSTRPRSCRAFVYAQRFGVEAYFEKRRVTACDGTRRTVDEIVSPFTRHVLLTLLDTCPQRRVDAFKRVAADVVPSVVQASYDDWVRSGET